MIKSKSFWVFVSVIALSILTITTVIIFNISSKSIHSENCLEDGSCCIDDNNCTCK